MDNLPPAVIEQVRKLQELEKLQESIKLQESELRTSRHTRALHIERLRESGATWNEISSMLRVSEKVARKYLEVKPDLQAMLTQYSSKLQDELEKPH